MGRGQRQVLQYLVNTGTPATLRCYKLPLFTRKEPGSRWLQSLRVINVYRSTILSSVIIGQWIENPDFLGWLHCHHILEWYQLHLSCPQHSNCTAAWDNNIILLDKIGKSNRESSVQLSILDAHPNAIECIWVDILFLFLGSVVVSLLETHWKSFFSSPLLKKKVLFMLEKETTTTQSQSVLN